MSSFSCWPHPPWRPRPTLRARLPAVADTTSLAPDGTARITREVFHRALLRKGVDARLVVFDAMPHAHWYTVGIPEATRPSS